MFLISHTLFFSLDEFLTVKGVTIGKYSLISVMGLQQTIAFWNFMIMYSDLRLNHHSFFLFLL